MILRGSKSGISQSLQGALVRATALTLPPLFTVAALAATILALAFDLRLAAAAFAAAIFSFALVLALFCLCRSLAFPRIPSSGTSSSGSPTRALPHRAVSFCIVHCRFDLAREIVSSIMLSESRKVRAWTSALGADTPSSSAMSSHCPLPTTLLMNRRKTDNPAAALTAHGSPELLAAAYAVVSAPASDWYRALDENPMKKAHPAAASEGS